VRRRDDERLADIVASADAITSHLERGDFDDGLVFDAVRVRLIEIGEAVKDIDPDVLTTEPGIPWRDVAGMRDHLAHRYFDTAHSIVQATVEDDLRPLAAAAGTCSWRQARFSAPRRRLRCRRRCPRTLPASVRRPWRQFSVVRQHFCCAPARQQAGFCTRDPLRISPAVLR